MQSDVTNVLKVTWEFDSPMKYPNSIGEGMNANILINIRPNPMAIGLSFSSTHLNIKKISTTNFNLVKKHILNFFFQFKFVKNPFYLFSD